MLSFDQIKELIDLVRERQLARLEIERAGFRIRIDGAAAPEATGGEPVTVAETATPVAETSAAPAPEEPASPAPEAAASEARHVVKSPIVGTFYAAPSPEADAYVQVGDRVKRGQVLCIVEAMKLMNEIESDVDGEILEIYPRNAQPVEFGEPLFAIG